MMGTLATVLAGKKIPTPKTRYRAEVEGHIQDVDGVLKITRINVVYHLKVRPGQAEDAKEAMSSYITFCPAAQSVIGCIEITDELKLEETAG